MGSDPAIALQEVEQFTVRSWFSQPAVGHDVRGDVEGGLDGDLQRVFHEPLLAQVVRNRLNAREAPEVGQAGLDLGQLLCDQGAVGHGCGTRAAIARQHRLQVEGLVPGPHFKGDTRRRVAIDDEGPLPQDPNAEINRRIVQNDEVNRRAEGALERTGEGKPGAIERVRRAHREQHRDIHVAVGPSGPVGDRAEQVRRRHARIGG